MTLHIGIELAFVLSLPKDTLRRVMSPHKRPLTEDEVDQRIEHMRHRLAQGDVYLDYGCCKYFDPAIGCAGSPSADDRREALRCTNETLGRLGLLSADPERKA